MPQQKPRPTLTISLSRAEILCKGLVARLKVYEDSGYLPQEVIRRGTQKEQDVLSHYRMPQPMPMGEDSKEDV